MPQVSPLAKEILFKVVYYGPGLGGKTSSLQHVYATTKAEHRGKMVSLATPVDRTLYFDFLPIRVPGKGDMTVRLQLFTVPGQVYYNATRRLVLTGADGVVFVADSQLDRSDANVESLRNLEENLLEHGRGLDEFPHVFAYNKRDLDQVTPIAEMERLLNAYGAPSFATVATSGEGVYESLDAITRAVLDDFEQRMPEHRVAVSRALVLPEGGLAEALRNVDDSDRYAPQSDATEQVAEAAAPESKASEPVAEAAAQEPALLGREPSAAAGSSPHSDRVAEELREGDEPYAPEPGTIPGLGISSSNPPIGLWRRRLGAIEPPPSESHSERDPAPGSSRVPVPASFVGIGMRSTPPSAPPSSEDSEEGGWPAKPMATAVPASAVVELSTTTKEAGCSLSLLWTNDERATVLQIEQAISLGQTRDCTILCNALLQRCIETLATALGRSSLEPLAALTLLGMAGPSYLEFLQLSLRARAKGKGIGREEALKLLLFVTECHLARERMMIR